MRNGWLRGSDKGGYVSLLAGRSGGVWARDCRAWPAGSALLASCWHVRQREHLAAVTLRGDLWPRDASVET